MSFLNKYNNADLQIKSVQEFLENNHLYNYSVGNSSENPAILKSKTDGTVVWKKDIVYEEWNSDITFREIIQSKTNIADPTYFLYASNDVEHYIVQIDKNGAFLSIKEIELLSPLGVYLVSSKINNNFYLIFSGLYDGSETTYGGMSLKQLMVLEFNSQIDIINKKYYATSSASDMVLNSVKTYDDGILILFDHKAGKTHLVDLDYNLSVKIVKDIHIGQGSFSDFFSNDMVIVSSNSSNFTLNRYFISGTNGAGTVLLLGLDGSVQNRIYEVPQSLGCKSSLIIVNSELYLNIYQNTSEVQGSVIHKFNYSTFSSLSVIWSKSFKISKDYHGIKKLVKSEINSIFIYASTDESLLFDSDLELTTCITVSLNYSIPQPTVFQIVNRTSLLTYIISYNTLALANLQVLDNSIERIKICDSQLDPEPCNSDQMFCVDYTSLLQNFTNCIAFTEINYPDFANDLRVFKDCFQNFLIDFEEMNNEYSNYEISTNFWVQINYINAFLEYTGTKDTKVYYDQALSAVLFIFESLSQLGNCNCESSFELTNFASIQSSNLYLQSAGSDGDDSTKGIHLRWALRERLAEHLPKGNYSSNTHNFNKKDDFVKIYRTKYVPYQVTLDFNNPPLQVNENPRQKNWIYNIGGKVFHVHFRNLIKYNQVRSTTNPFTESLEFIQSYGDSLLEIENKTELSFKIAPQFIILNEDNRIKTELLSVSENKITASKGASLRKIYTAVVLNATQLLGENIRSIRFTSTNAYVVSLSFEFYSDFIKTTQIAKNWKVLGKYALSKDANIAFQRLEPQPNCLDNWLRYNDEAYVNSANYHTKWNSTSLPLMERISTVVTKYIDLSEALDNTRALEYFPFDNYDDAAACNSINPDYDPYIPETPLETNGIEIPFLDVLVLGSMDYHVARMLGLGVLDLNPLVFEGEYMYLSEYFTFGDLQDGLGPRKVQHLYCSLPTSLADHRLPAPIDLKDPVPGVFFSNGYNNSDVQDEDDEEIDHEHNNFTGLELTVDGYTPDGKARYYSLFVESLHEEQSNAPFYYVDKEFIACETTDPIFAGLEYRKVGAGSNWIKPELSYSPVFFNIDSSGVPQIVTNETVELVIPEQGEPVFTHVVKESGEMEYSSYGINWFSRATSSENVFHVTTNVAPSNQLLPPTNVTATLIQKESPLFLTTSSEQVLYRDNPAFDTDKTLVRLTFEYNHGQELIDYHQKINGELLPAYFEVPNGKEVFAEKLQIFFRDQIPNGVAGKIKQINLMDNPLLVEVQTEPYSVISSGINTDLDPQTIPPTYNETYLPYIVPGTEGNYVGSILLVNGVEFVVHEVDTTDEYPKFIVFKAEASGSLLNLNSLTNSTNEIVLPEMGGLFMVVDNMQTPAVWGLPNSNGFNITVDLDQVHREDDIILNNMDCTSETHVQKFRGLYNEASIAKIYEKVIQNEDGTFDIIIDGYEPNNNLPYTNKHLGLYKVSFTETSLSQHSQYKLDTHPGQHSVEWFNGIVRLHTLENGGKAPRKDFKVVRTENIGTDQPLVLYIQDPTFPAEQELSNYKGRIMNESTTEITQLTNYYPGYKVYLYNDNALALNKDTVLPQGEDSIRYTVFGLRSWDLPNEFEFDNNVDFFSKMSVPTLMFAKALAEPVRPQKPTGGLFATRPDYFGKSTYTFHTKYGTPINKSKPYSVQFNRASDIQFLSAIYDNTVEGYDSNQQPILNTVQEVMQNIFMNGEENFYVDRWMDLLSFNYPTGLFATFDGRTLPIPNNKNFIKGINDFVDAHNEYYNLTGNDIVEHLQPGFNLSTQVIEEGTNNSELLVWHFVKDVLLNCFVPLTEIPVLYNYVKGGDYEPIPKKQVIRDRNGNLLKPTHSDFDMAPMMKRIDPLNEQYESKFTDFGLDGASNARYFYAAREINSQLQTSDYSSILGPISLVNTAPPIAPEIIKIIPILENRILGIIPSIQFQINAYPKAQNIAKISIYRAENPADALSIRTMKFVKRLDLEVENLLDESKWIFEDDFSDLVEVPFGDPLYYRVTVSRRIKYNDKDASTIIDYTPSEASKLIITNVVENYSPATPYIDYYSEPLTLNNELKTVVLHWQKACYKAKYHLYKMNSQGNWVKIYELQNNDQDIYLPLELTELATDTLSTADSNGNLIYNHFKVITENTAGMTSREEYILTVHNETNWQDIGGIGDMIVGGTFYIR